MKRLKNSESSSDGSEDTVNNYKKKCARGHDLDVDWNRYFSNSDSDESGREIEIRRGTVSSSSSSSDNSSDEEDEYVKPDGSKHKTTGVSVTSMCNNVRKPPKHDPVDDTRSLLPYVADEFKSADDSTSVFVTIEDTETGLISLTTKDNRIDELPPREVKFQFYSKLLPVFIKTHLLQIELISIPEEFLHTVIRGQGVHKFFTFENIRVFNLDNATLLLDHRYVGTGGNVAEYVLKVVGCPVSTTLASFPRHLTTEANIFTGAGENRSFPSRHFVRSHLLRDGFSLTRPSSAARSSLMHHSFSQSIPPPGVFWNAYDPAIPKRGGFDLKIQEAVQDRTIFLDFLFLLGTVDDGSQMIQRAKGAAKWEPVKMKDPVERAAITIHTMLCFGFRILSFGLLCEYTKPATSEWIKGHNEADERYRRQAYAAKRREQMNNHTYIEDVRPNIKRQPVMRMMYALDSTFAAKNFFQIMDTHAETMKKRTVRSRLFYKNKIRWDTVGRSYVYPNNSLYMVLGSCNIVYSTREMSVCTKSLTASLLNKLDDQPRRDFDDVKEAKTEMGPKRVVKKQTSKSVSENKDAIKGGVVTSKKRMPASSGDAAASDLKVDKKLAIRKTSTASVIKLPKQTCDTRTSSSSKRTKTHANAEMKNNTKRSKTETVQAEKGMQARKPFTLSPAPLSKSPTLME